MLFEIGGTTQQTRNEHSHHHHSSTVRRTVQYCTYAVAMIQFYRTW